ncbi:SANT/Myb_domain [Hexamita inflata]|uniref:SANT/Myb domain n=1 Tax=Hexamita inflata TaxID=28002 RepID=A0AA86Q901_9EUKA|nr:SANT/Myb domain [Hexamita inflata]
MDNRQSCRWTQAEIDLFDQMVQKVGKNFKVIAEKFSNRSYAQVRSRYYNLQIKNNCSQDSKEMLAKAKVSPKQQNIKAEESLSESSSKSNGEFMNFNQFQ